MVDKNISKFCTDCECIYICPVAKTKDTYCGNKITKDKSKLIYKLNEKIRGGGK